MSDKLRRIVLTGGPGSGKSTLIEVLHRRGYPHSQEAGRAIIQEQVSIGGNALPWGDRRFRRADAGLGTALMAGSDGRNMLVLRSRPAGYRRLPDAVRVADPRPLTAAIGAFAMPIRCSSPHRGERSTRRTARETIFRRSRADLSSDAGRLSPTWLSAAGTAARLTRRARRLSARRAGLPLAACVLFGRQRLRLGPLFGGFTRIALRQHRAHHQLHLVENHQRQHHGAYRRGREQHVGHRDAVRQALSSRRRRW